MTEQWIPASKAIEIANDEVALCTRLHAGLISARADLLIINHKEERSAKIPQGFWWSEGHAALQQDWRSGDFETWIDGKLQCKAFGVKFALSEVLEMVPFERRALIARSLSVAGNPDWVSAQVARQLSYEAGHRKDPSEAILELARLGFVSGRAVELEAYRQMPTGHEIKLEQREWDIEPWFWRDFLRPGKGSRDWDLGKFSAAGIGPSDIQYVALSGVHFLRESLAALESAKPLPLEADEQKRGRKPSYEWAAASSAVWGRLNRGELMPHTQADLELALINALTKGDTSPSESTVRPYAKLIWEEFQKP
ncbi:MAG: hypothetical protein H6915_03015 [Novosphingobium sp.]|nr:hypothetical protein [Novosphingobium sp.]MCP5388712.1 hypothetical protein [Novosphingobium sp.]